MTVEKILDGTHVIVHMPDDLEAALAAYAKRLSIVLNRDVWVEPDDEAAE